jgi:oligogalacturonide transport system substrate-binding protein
MPAHPRQGITRRSALAAATLGVCTRVHAQQPSSLRFAWWGGASRHEATLKALALFERRNPGLKVKAEYMGFNGYLERLTTQIAGGSEPDLMQINWAWLAMFSKRGNGFQDLLKFPRDINPALFNADDLKTGMVAGKLNALPVSYTARVLLWNAATFQRAGLPLPRNWDDVFASGAVFRSRLGERFYPLDGELYDMLLLAQAFVQQKHGMAYLDPAAPRVAMPPAVALEWVQTYRRLIDGHVATPLKLRASLGGAEKATEQQQDWVVGHWAGNFTWDSAINLRQGTLNKEQKLVLGDFPMLPGARNSGMFGRPTLMLAVGRNSKQPELAARLSNFLLFDPEAAALLGRTRGLPLADAALQALIAAKKVPEIELQAHRQIREQKAAGRIEAPQPLFEHARFQKFMREVFETVAYAKTSDADAAQRLVDDGNALLKRIK